MSDTAPRLALSTLGMTRAASADVVPPPSGMSHRDTMDALRMLALGGSVALLFGLLALLNPGSVSLLLMFGLYAIVDGVLAIVIGISAADQRAEWWPLSLTGDITVLAGVAAVTTELLLPAAGFQVHGVVVTLLALTIGAVSMVLGFLVRGSDVCGRSLAFKGMLVVGFAGLVALAPMVAGAPFWMLIGAYGAGVGGTLLALALRKSLTLQTSTETLNDLPASAPWLDLGSLSLLRRGATER